MTDFERSISVSTIDNATTDCEDEDEDDDDDDDDDDFDLDDDDFPESETIWKVVKFVAALKRNSRKRQLWVRNGSNTHSILRETDSMIFIPPSPISAGEQQARPAEPEPLS